MASPLPSPETQTATLGARHARRVTEMRAHWHREAELRAGGTSVEAEREKARGDALFSLLLSDLKGALHSQAHVYLQDHSLIPDGISEQIVGLYKHLRELRDTPTTQGWETPQLFWTCFRRHANNLFLRSVQRDNGKGNVTMTDAEGVTTRTKAEVKESEIGVGDGMSPFSSATDLNAERDFARFLDADLLRDLLTSIPDGRYRDALVLDCQGVPQAEIARKLNVSPKTVYNYIEKGRQAAFRWAQSQYDAHGKYAQGFAPSVSEQPWLSSVRPL